MLGGGIVPGAAILLSGEPGVGKSTLLLEVASRAARHGLRVLYVSAEESASQVRLRAERTGALDDELYLAAETDLATILGQVDAVQPELLIVDSVQTVSSALSDGAAGQPAQVREVAATLIRVAKERNLPVLLVGHVTKDGSIAGPRLLEHLVDVVCSFEGDRQTALRFVRALKNRFGPTDEVGCFEMTGDGIAEVPDPSGLFLSRGVGPGQRHLRHDRARGPTRAAGRGAGADREHPGAAAAPGGQRRRLVARRDAARGARAALRASSCRRRTSTSRPWAASASPSRAPTWRSRWPSQRRARRALSATLAAVGEISLAGEIRPVAAARQRAAEAKRLGFSTVLDGEPGPWPKRSGSRSRAPGHRHPTVPAF